MVQLCAICGIEKATTKDHVPPKGIFVRPRPSNLVTVPACVKCNNHSSELDERFLADLGVHVSIDQDEGQRLFTEQVMKTLRHNKKLHSEILNRVKTVEFTTPDGVPLAKTYIGSWDKEPHLRIIERTIRGLYYHHYNEILGSDYIVKTYFFDSLTTELQETSKNWALNTIGNIVYNYTKADRNGETASVWIFQFYGSHWAGGHIVKVGSTNA
jgi:hypothetical protein